MKNFISRKTVSCLVLAFNMIFSSCNFLWGGIAGESYEEMFDSMWKDYKETYALFTVRNVDWDASYEKYRPLIDNCENDRDFFDVCKQMLYELKDAHVYIKAPFDSMNSGDGNSKIMISDNFKTETAINMEYMFCGCSKLTSIRFNFVVENRVISLSR